MLQQACQPTAKVPVDQLQAELQQQLDDCDEELGEAEDGASGVAIQVLHAHSAIQPSTHVAISCGQDQHPLHMLETPLLAARATQLVVLPQTHTKISMVHLWAQA